MTSHGFVEDVNRLRKGELRDGSRIEDGEVYPELISGQVYKAPNGRPMIYVRTEQRPNATEPEHFFIEARDRVVYDRWVPTKAPLPELMVKAIA